MLGCWYNFDNYDQIYAHSNGLNQALLNVSMEVYDRDGSEGDTTLLSKTSVWQFKLNFLFVFSYINDFLMV